MDWTSPEVLPVVSALGGVLLTGVIALLADGLNGWRESRRRKADLAERLFDQKREAYLGYYRLAVEFKALMEDAEEALGGAVIESKQRTPPSASSSDTGADERTEDLKALVQRLEKYDGADALRARDAEVRFYGPRAVADAARGLTAATVTWAASTMIAVATSLLVKLGDDVEPPDPSEHAEFEQAFDQAERAFLEAAKKDLGASL